MFFMMKNIKKLRQITFKWKIILALKSIYQNAQNAITPCFCSLFVLIKARNWSTAFVPFGKVLPFGDVTANMLKMYLGYNQGSNKLNRLFELTMNDAIDAKIERSANVSSSPAMYFWPSKNESTHSIAS